MYVGLYLMCVMMSRPVSVDDLGSPSWRVREWATRRLTYDRPREALAHASVKHENPEVRLRAAAILDDYRGAWSSIRMEWASMGRDGTCEIDLPWVRSQWPDARHEVLRHYVDSPCGSVWVIRETLGNVNWDGSRTIRSEHLYNGPPNVAAIKAAVGGR